MKHRQDGTVLIIFVGLLSVFISAFICAVNVYSVISDQQYLRNVVDQAALIGTNQIELNYYYSQGLTKDLQLDDVEVHRKITSYLKETYVSSEILTIRIDTAESEVNVLVEKKSSLPIRFGISYVKISAFASAKLQVK